MLHFVRRGPEVSQPMEGLEGWLSAILRSRGVDTPEKAERFLHPSLSHLHDPMLMQGMDKAVRILRDAAQRKLPVVVYGDYDVDGVCATSIMLETLGEMGISASWRIPSRHGEGYGLNEDAVREMAKSANVLITVDCGVTNHQEVALARSLGMTVIVTDHHQLPPEPSPADAVLNPLLGGYPFPRLCGAGVALKLTQALLGMEAATRRLDLAALATVADIVPLIDENRVIVRFGLEQLSRAQRPGLSALMREAGITPPVTSTQIAFRLAPRINAGGRLEDAGQCVRLLTTQSPEQAQPIARHLESQNQQRQDMQQDMLHQAEDMMAQAVDFYDDLVIVIMGENWNSGVIGLVAGKLCEKYHFPAIVLSRQGDTAVGSCRSIPGVNIHAMLSGCADLFIRFGGHEQAAGLTIPVKLVEEMRRRLNLLIRQSCDLACYIPRREYDAQASLDEVNLDMIDRLDALQPTGFGNPAPTFLVRGAQVQQARAVGRDLSHLKLSLLEGRAVRDGIAFGMGYLAQEGLEQVDVLFSPERNEFRGRVSAQLQVQAIQPASAAAALPGPLRSPQLLFHALLQEMQLLAENNNQIPTGPAQADAAVPKPEPITSAALARLMQPGRGVLVICHEHGRAREAALLPMHDTCAGTVRDARAFNTVLFAPRLDLLQDVWQHIVLLDGAVVPREAQAIARLCPRAALHAMKPNAALAQLLSSLAMDDEALRTLYRCLRAHPSQDLGALCQASGLSPEQALTGLTAFSQVGLVRLTLEPYAALLLPPVKCRMDDSALVRYLRAPSMTTT